MITSLESPILKIAFIISSFSSGGISPVCIYAAQGFAKQSGFSCTVLALHGQAQDFIDKLTSVRMRCLGVDQDSSRAFIDWLNENPQDVIISNDVSNIEPSFPYLPINTIHIVGLHDFGRRYIDVILRNRKYINGVWCVARNVEDKLRSRLGQSGFSGVIKTVYNGAQFPDRPERAIIGGPIGLLFMGRMDPLVKGIFDLVPILNNLKMLGVPFKLTIAGGRHNFLESRFRKYRLDKFVSWAGTVRREDCYQLASTHQVLLMTSRREPFGMVTIEAMAMGCVPIAYDIPSGSREIIENGKCGLLLPLGDFRAWAHAIQYFQQNPCNWLKMSRAATDRARNQFNINRLAIGMHDFLIAVLLQSKLTPCVRKAGAVTFVEAQTIQRTYRRLPSAFRDWVRSTVGLSPKLSWWWLNH